MSPDSPKPPLLICPYVVYRFGSVTAVLTSRFLLNLQQADRTATATRKSAPMAAASESLTIAAGGSRSRARHRTLPAFIASMGELVRTELDIGDSTAMDEEEGMVAHANGEEPQLEKVTCYLGMRTWRMGWI